MGFQITWIAIWFSSPVTILQFVMNGCKENIFLGWNEATIGTEPLPQKAEVIPGNKHRGSIALQSRNSIRTQPKGSLEVLIVLLLG